MRMSFGVILCRTELADDPEGHDPFQIDDGWQKHWGDWKADRTFLGYGTAGYRCPPMQGSPGLWMAPFMFQPLHPSFRTWRLVGSRCEGNPITTAISEPETTRLST